MVLPCRETFYEDFLALLRDLPPHDALVPAGGPHPAMPQLDRILPVLRLERLL